VADYFASDIHLRLDYPDRGRRLAAWVETLQGGDSVTIVGDLCDFWLTSRQFPLDAAACPGFRALSEFRARGGTLVILPGNHDHRLAAFYEKALGATYIREGFQDLELHGLKLHVTHGHDLRAPARWKTLMETDFFLKTFGGLPGLVAHALERTLETTNALRRRKVEDRQIVCYREFSDRFGGSKDLVVLGHVHRAVDDSTRSPRMIVLGDWIEGASYLKVDEAGAHFVVEPSGSQSAKG
jgi:UDP-2,3-diacylglucosamine hydrolase